MFPAELVVGGLILTTLVVCTAIILAAVPAPKPPPSEPPPRSAVRELVLERMGTRPCYCPRARWLLWREGLEAGPDKVVGTADDVKIEQTPS